jgi:hypothetical protein
MVHETNSCLGLLVRGIGDGSGRCTGTSLPKFLRDVELVFDLCANFDLFDLCADGDLLDVFDLCDNFDVRVFVMPSRSSRPPRFFIILWRIDWLLDLLLVSNGE